MDSTAMGVVVNSLVEPMGMAGKEEEDLFKVEQVVVLGTMMLLEDLEEVEVRTEREEELEEEEDIQVERQVIVGLVRVVAEVDLSIVERIKRKLKDILPVAMVMSK